MALGVSARVTGRQVVLHQGAVPRGAGPAVFLPGGEAVGVEACAREDGRGGRLRAGAAGWRRRCPGGGRAGSETNRRRTGMRARRTTSAGRVAGVRRHLRRPPPFVARLALELVLLPLRPSVRSASSVPSFTTSVVDAADPAERPLGVDKVQRVEGGVHPLPAGEQVADRPVAEECDQGGHGENQAHVPAGVAAAAPARLAPADGSGSSTARAPLCNSRGLAYGLGVSKPTGGCAGRSLPGSLGRPVRMADHR